MRLLVLVLAIAAMTGCGRGGRRMLPVQDAIAPRVIGDPGPPPAPADRAPEKVAASARAGDDVPPPPPIRDRKRPDLSALTASLEDAYFPYDRSEPLPDSVAALARDARVVLAILADFPGTEILVEGHCDDRGSAEYNLGLGDRRARTAATLLIGAGVPNGSLQIVSYGKEMPQCAEETEGCRQRNRRAHLSVRPATSPATFE